MLSEELFLVCSKACFEYKKKKKKNRILLFKAFQILKPGWTFFVEASC